jgi:hypothetical protein
MVQRPARVDLVREPLQGGSLPSDTGETLKAVLYPARVSSLSDTELDALVAEAVLN